ncbi:xanthine dehydrogenase family protein molybdopterin-binding subunit [Pokkaliibacter sp. CJK22405]|uniref:xanthine dehydrogenase family protein molybdopterin-binding subunit n=1 Tax=Pokkaliibacter sp. CJK22405 TaxID=3384615 RepID=UPI003984CA3A
MSEAITPRQTSVVGNARRRVDGRLKVTGQAHYAADHHPENVAYAYGVFSTVAKGTIQHLDIREAQSMPGVLDIFHHGHFPDLSHGAKGGFSLGKILTASNVDEHRLPFEDNTVYYPGQFVALVVAESFEQARAAAQKVSVSYSETQPVISLAEGIRQGQLSNGGGGHERGNPEQGYQQGAKQLDVTYTTPMEVHNPMEMHATTAMWRDGKLYVYESSQGVVSHRNYLSEVFDLPPDRIEVQAPFIGSGFGSKLWPWPHSVAVCAAAKMLKRPVQIMLPRAQMFTTTGHRPETQQRLRLATDATGKLTSLRHESINSTSTFENYSENCGVVSKNLYSCDNVMVSQKNVGINRGTPTSMRAPGAAPGLFALESAMDEMAYAVGMDPLAFRKLNLADRDESVDLPWSSNHLPEALEQASKKFGWDKRNPAIGSMREGDEIIGYGLAACNWDAFCVPCEARVTLRANGKALVQCGLQDIGTGTYTVAAQIVSEITGLAIEDIEVELGSSSFPAGPVSGGSWATASLTSALTVATREALEKVRDYAVAANGVFEGVPTPSVTLSQGSFNANGKQASIGEILKAHKVSRAEGYHHSDGADMSKYSFRSFGVHFVEIGWDPGISRLRVRRVVSAIDVGKVINPLTASNQVEGAIVMGVGMALFEAGEYDEHSGLPTNNNYAEYVVPVHADQPDIDVILLDYPDTHLNELGARGIGEIGITGLAAAVANAVYHATGKRVRDLPITKEKLMEELLAS